MALLSLLTPLGCASLPPFPCWSGDLLPLRGAAFLSFGWCFLAPPFLSPLYVVFFLKHKKLH